MNFNPEHYRDLLSIDPDHTLQLADSKQRRQHQVRSESHLIKELDVNEKLVAHYRVWTQESDKTPYRTQKGWEKYALDGSLLDREVRYSRQADGVTLH